jgi:hypothetical protein
MKNILPNYSNACIHNSFWIHIKNLNIKMNIGKKKKMKWERFPIMYIVFPILYKANDEK